MRKIMINFDNTYINLPTNFYHKSYSQKFKNPKLIAYNKDLADELGIDLSSLSEKDLAQIFSGQLTPEGAQPIALAYAGHQFGHFVPQLGDGRALLLGEVLNSDNQRFDIQLKGSGPTYYSRRGDGLSSLGPVIREYILSEAMSYLGVPTTRSLAAVETGEEVYRQEVLPGGVFTRVASSHIRVGTFQFFAAQGDFESIRELADYTINRHYSYLLTQHSNRNIYLRFIEEVAEKQSHLVSKWMSLGFIHGVMNTDNMSIVGETLDFGPCAFMDNYSYSKVFSSIDAQGRYAYNNQTSVAKWNLYRFAECLVPLVDSNIDKAIKLIEETVNGLTHIYNEKTVNQLIKKIGLFEIINTEKDEELVLTFLEYLQENELDFTLSFRKLSLSICDPEVTFLKTDLYEKFEVVWRQRLEIQGKTNTEVVNLMNSVNPVFIPRNHQVENAIKAALNGDYSIFNEMNECLKKPFKDRERFNKFKKAPLPEEEVNATFCGT